MNNRVALIRATIPTSPEFYNESFEEKKLADSLAVSSLQAWLMDQPEAWDVLAINPVLDDLGAKEAAARVVEFDPMAVGVSLTYQWQQPWVSTFSDVVRSRCPDAHVVVGGMYATSAWRELLHSLPSIDSISRYEGERTLRELLNLLRAGEEWRGIDGLAYRDSQGEPTFHKLRQRIVDLGTLPFPTREYLPQVLAAGGVIQVEASRACNAHCTFCDVRMTGWVPRPINHLIDEIEGLVAQHPGHELWIVDNIFIGFGKARFERARTFAKELIRRDIQVNFTFQDRAENVDRETFQLLKLAGLNKVYLGIESFAQSALTRWEKDTTAEQNIAALLTLRDLRIVTQIGFLVFDDGTTFDEIRETLLGLRKVTENNPYLHLHNYNELIPYAGTHLARQYERSYGRAPDPTSESLWNFRDPRIRTYRNWAWEFLLRIWPATEVIFRNLDRADFQSDLIKLIPDKNRYFVEYMEQLIRLVEADEVPERLCAGYVEQTKAALTSRMLEWENLDTAPVMTAAIERIRTGGAS